MKRIIMSTIGVLVLLGAGCRFPGSEVNTNTSDTAKSPGLGSLSIEVIGVNVAARTILPANSDLPTISKYFVRMTRSGYTDRTGTFNTSPCSMTELEFGAWNIQVDGLTSANLTVATGTTTATVAASGSATVALDYIPAATGQSGGASITLVFPKSVGINEVSGSLEGSALTLSIVSVDSTYDKVVYSSSSIDIANPLLKINLSKSGTKLLSWAERLWVYQNITTTMSDSLLASAFSSAPTTPATLSGGVASSKIRPTWPNSNTAESYTLERSTDAGSTWSTLVSGSSLPAGSTGYTDSSSANGTSYMYRISAVNTFGTSATTSSSALKLVTVTYDSQSATTAPSPSSAAVLSDVAVGSVPSNQARSGWTFGNWYTEAAGVGTQFTAASTVTSDTTVFAKWYKTLVFNNVTPAYTPKPSDATLVFGSASTTLSLPTTPTLSGHTFDGWFTASSGTGTRISSVGDTTVSFTTTTGSSATIGANAYSSTAASETLYAGFKKATVTYDSQSATVEASPTSKVVYAPNTTVVSLPTAPTKTGTDASGWWTFGGWWTASSGGGTSFLAGTAVTADITVYARWDRTWVVTFDSQSATTDASPTTISVVTPAASTVGSLPTAPSKTNFLFGGWYTDNTTFTTQFLANTTVSANITVYAKWVPIYTVTFSKNHLVSDATQYTVPSPTTATTNLEFKVAALPSTAPTLKDYYFDKWTTQALALGSSDAYTEFTTSSIVGTTASVYAKWLPAWTITFDPLATHTLSPTWKTVIPGGTLPENASSSDRFRPTASSAVGNTFGGWYKDQSFTNYFDESSTSSTGYYFDAGTAVTNHRTVYARYFPTKIYTSLASSPDGKYIAAAYEASTGTNNIDISSDFGVTWTSSNITGSASTESFDWLSIKRETDAILHVVAISRDSNMYGKVYVSHNAGASGSWTKTYPSSAVPAFPVGTIAIGEAGYRYTSAPTVTISAPPAGVAATAQATVTGGYVTAISITSVGSGYTSAPTVTISAPNESNTNATATISATTTWGDTILLQSNNHLSASADGKYLLINLSYWTCNGSLVRGGLAYSSDYGATWTNSMGHSNNVAIGSTNGFTSQSAYTSVAVSGDGSTMYACSSSAVTTWNYGTSRNDSYGPLFKSTDHGATWVGFESPVAAPSNLWTSTDGSKVAIAGSNMKNHDYDYTKDVSISINSGATFDAGNKVNFSVSFPPGDSWLRMVFSDDLYSFGMPAKDIVQTPRNDIGSGLYTGQYTASLASAAGRTYLSTHTKGTSSLNGNNDWKGFDMSTNGKIWYACQGGYGNIYWSTDGASWRVIH
ncbi:MAG: InlB B-repeat-containing protein [Rectinemataceae bacterium]